MVEASATTNLSEVNADFLRLWQPAVLNHVDIREIFVDKGQITNTDVVTTPVGNGEVETSLVYSNPTNKQIPALKDLLDYLAQYPSGTVNKYYTINRTQQAIFNGDTHLLNRQVTKNIKNQRVVIEQHAPITIQRTKVVKSITRPIYIFNPY